MLVILKQQRRNRRHSCSSDRKTCCRCRLPCSEAVDVYATSELRGHVLTMSTNCIKKPTSGKSDSPQRAENEAHSKDWMSRPVKGAAGALCHTKHPGRRELFLVVSRSLRVEIHYRSAGKYSVCDIHWMHWSSFIWHEQALRLYLCLRTCVCFFEAGLCKNQHTEARRRSGRSIQRRLKIAVGFKLSLSSTLVVCICGILYTEFIHLHRIRGIKISIKCCKIRLINKLILLFVVKSE